MDSMDPSMLPPDAKEFEELIGLLEKYEAGQGQGFGPLPEDLQVCCCCCCCCSRSISTMLSQCQCFFKSFQRRLTQLYEATEELYFAGDYGKRKAGQRATSSCTASNAGRHPSARVSSMI